MVPAPSPRPAVSRPRFAPPRPAASSRPARRPRLRSPRCEIVAFRPRFWSENAVLTFRWSESADFTSNRRRMDRQRRMRMLLNWGNAGEALKGPSKGGVSQVRSAFSDHRPPSCEVRVSLWGASAFVHRPASWLGAPFRPPPRAAFEHPRDGWRAGPALRSDTTCAWRCREGRGLRQRGERRHEAVGGGRHALAHRRVCRRPRLGPPRPRLVVRLVSSHQASLRLRADAGLACSDPGVRAGRALACAGIERAGARPACAWPVLADSRPAARHADPRAGQAHPVCGWADDLAPLASGALPRRLSRGVPPSAARRSGVTLMRRRFRRSAGRRPARSPRRLVASPSPARCYSQASSARS